MPWTSERGDPWKRRIDGWLGRPLVFLVGRFRRSRTQPKRVERCGILMLAAIGDSILSSAITHDLRGVYPDIRITAFVSRANRSVVELLDGFDEIVELPASHPLRALSIIRRTPMDLLIDVGQWTRLSALLSAFSGAAFTAGFETRGQHRHLAYDRTAAHLNTRHEMENFRSLVTCLGIEATAEPRLSASALPPFVRTNPYIVIHPWAAGYKFVLREWREENWVAVIDHAIALGVAVMISGGPADKEKSLRMMRLSRSPEHVTVLAGQTSLKETAAILRQAEAVIAVNTGTMHLAAALDCPLIALHGPTNPLRWGPVSHRAVSLGPGPDRGGAYLNLGFEYPKSPPDSMALVTVTEVLARLDAMLDHAERERGAPQPQTPPLPRRQSLNPL